MDYYHRTNIEYKEYDIMNKSYKLAKIFSLIPIIAIFIVIILFISAYVTAEALELYSVFFVVPGFLIILIGGLPMLVFSILGIIFSIKSIKNNNKSTIFLILSFIDIFISISLLYTSYYIIFIAGPSV